MKVKLVTSDSMQRGVAFAFDDTAVVSKLVRYCTFSKSISFSFNVLDPAKLPNFDPLRVAVLGLWSRPAKLTTIFEFLPSSQMGVIPYAFPRTALNLKFTS